ncbi:MAG: HlyD family type I secretion periplasmic adaptor subunit [Pseudomonadota bacterium]
MPNEPTQDTAALPYPRKIDRIANDAHRLFVLMAGVGLLAFFVWSITTRIDQVTRGSGRVVPQVQNQIVEHFDGGIVASILVQEGQRVDVGEPLLRIENTFSSAELAEMLLDLKAREVKLARLRVEVSGEDTMIIPDGLASEIPGIVEREVSLFRRRQQGLASQLAIQDDQIRQKELEFSELQSRWANTTRERDFVSQHVESLRGLLDVGAVSRNELLENERQLAQIETRLSDLVHDIPRVEAALSETRRRRNEAILIFREEAETDLNETELVIAKRQEQIAALQERSRRSEVTAPIAGRVNKLFVSTLGSVVKSGEPLLELVPTGGSIAVEMKLPPADRAEVWPGLPAVVKISAYEYSIYGGIEGRVVDISPDAFTDEQGRPYFRVRLEADGNALGTDNPVVPGMVADVDILTSERTILSYLTKPVRLLSEKALRE